MLRPVFVDTGYVTAIVNKHDNLHQWALALAETYDDKTWGLVDCLSFVVMKQMNLTTVLGFDQHFVQAGFKLAGEKLYD